VPLAPCVGHMYKHKPERRFAAASVRVVWGGAEKEGNGPEMRPGPFKSANKGRGRDGERSIRGPRNRGSYFFS
jgi:hypothetical protein